MFQFHFGSIGSVYEGSFIIQQSSFNSTLVRLEDMQTIEKITCFTVSIPLWFDWKYLRQIIINYIKSSFNSTLVRLEASPPISSKYSVPPFQFHFGSIGSEEDSIGIFNNTVSIPLWFDWKGDESIDMENPIVLFQFHFGSIGSFITIERTANSSLFQFHFGSIGS